MDVFNNQNNQNYGYDQNQGQNYGYNPQPRPVRPSSNQSQAQNYGYSNQGQIPVQKQNYNNGANYNNGVSYNNGASYNNGSNYNNGQIAPRSGWSWGAFMFTILYGLGNYTWMPFLCLVPVLNIFWWIVCGIKGHEWAMKSGRFRTVEEFNAVQDSWDRVGKIYFFISLGVGVLSWIIMTIIGVSLLSFLSMLSGSYNYA